MPLTLEQYAAWLDSRNLAWPPPPVIDRPRAKPHLVALPNVRAVLWNVYGTLLAITGGELYLEHPEPFLMANALDRTIQEFKMWQSMSRKPGQPSEYLLEIYRQIILEQKTAAGAHDRFPEVDVARVWEAVFKRLMQKDYQFDARFYGSLNELCRKVAYFFHATLQGCTAFPGAAEVLSAIAAGGRTQALAADGQCFSSLQLQRALAAQDPACCLAKLIPEPLAIWSFEVRARPESERFLRHVLAQLPDAPRPEEILYVTSRLPALATAKRLFLRTALFAGDRHALIATPEQLREPGQRPDILFTELTQLLRVLEG